MGRRDDIKQLKERHKSLQSMAARLNSPQTKTKPGKPATPASAAQKQALLQALSQPSAQPNEAEPDSEPELDAPETQENATGGEFDNDALGQVQKNTPGNLPQNRKGGGTAKTGGQTSDNGDGEEENGDDYNEGGGTAGASGGGSGSDGDLISGATAEDENAAEASAGGADNKTADTGGKDPAIKDKNDRNEKDAGLNKDGSQLSGTRNRETDNDGQNSQKGTGHKKSDGGTINISSEAQKRGIPWQAVTMARKTQPEIDKLAKEFEAAAKTDDTEEAKKKMDALSLKLTAEIAKKGSNPFSSITGCLGCGSCMGGCGDLCGCGFFNKAVGGKGGCSIMLAFIFSGALAAITGVSALLGLLL